MPPLHVLRSSASPLISVHDFESLYLNSETGEPLPRKQSQILVVDIRPAAANSAARLASSSINVPIGEYLQGETLHPDALRLSNLVGWRLVLPLSLRRRLSVCGLFGGPPLRRQSHCANAAAAAAAFPPFPVPKFNRQTAKRWSWWQAAGTASRTRRLWRARLFSRVSHTSAS